MILPIKTRLINASFSILKKNLAHNQENSYSSYNQNSSSRSHSSASTSAISASNANNQNSSKPVVDGTYLDFKEDTAPPENAPVEQKKPVTTFWETFNKNKKRMNHAKYIISIIMDHRI